MNETGVSLLKNSNEQAFAEKLRSLLKFGPGSRRYKDIYDMYYLKDHMNDEKFDEIFAQNQQYIGKYGAGGIGTRYSDFIKYMESGMPIHASTVVVTEENNRPIVSFVDGRHRYSVMRDLGFERIPVSMDESSKEVAEKYGLLK